MQAGSLVIGTNTVVTFPVAFSNIPLIFLSPVDTNRFCGFSAMAADTATLSVTDEDGTASTGAVHWLAIGPE